MHRLLHSTFLSMSLESIMRHFLATLYLLHLWHLPQTQRQRQPLRNRAGGCGPLEGRAGQTG